jgi:uncharacterized protein with NRDE domain
VAANRDELLDRPSRTMTVLRDEAPRILGGRDEVAGGTWLAVNELGLCAALTNRPSGSHDPAKRSRGEWPVFLAGFASPLEAASAFVDRYDPADFNPGWILVGNGRELVYIDMSTNDRGRPIELEPGIHILENRPLEAESPKIELVRELLTGIGRLEGERLIEQLQVVLGDHRTPDAPRRDSHADASQRPAEADAACVHLGAYGTRSATIVRVEDGGEPRVWATDGPPCTHSFAEVSGLWKDSKRQASGV